MRLASDSGVHQKNDFDDSVAFGCGPFDTLEFYKRHRHLTGEVSASLTGFYGQVENFIGTIRVFQLNVPLVRMYSVVNQKVESSTGSTLIVE